WLNRSGDDERRRGRSNVVRNKAGRCRARGILQFNQRPGYVRHDTVEHRPVGLVFRIRAELVQLPICLVLAIELIADKVSYLLWLKILQVIGQRRLDHLEDARTKTWRGSLRWRLTRVERRHLPVAPVGLDVAGRDDGHVQELLRDAVADGSLQHVIDL